MMGLLFLFGLFLFAGLFSLAAAFLQLPGTRITRAMLGTMRQEKKTAKMLEACLMSISIQLAKYIRIEEYKRGRMDRVLKAGGINLSPEVYQAYALTKAGAILLMIIPCIILFPLLSPVVFILAVLIYFKEIQKADEKLKEKRAEIEGELPRMVATIEQELKASRNVIGMLERYRSNAGKALKGRSQIDPEEVYKFIEAIEIGVQKRGNAKVGDKTFLDGIDPAIPILKKLTAENSKTVLSEAAIAAKKGSDATVGMLAKHGRMAIRGEDSRSYIDPGSVVGALLIQGLRDGLLEG